MAYELDVQAVLLCSGVLAFLPVTTWSLWLIGKFVMSRLHWHSKTTTVIAKCKQNESAIRASVANKIGQNNNSSNNKPQQQQQQGNNIHHHGKNETNAVGQQQQANNNNNNVSQQSTPNHANKSRKSRNNNKHGNQSSPGKKQSPNSQDKQGTQKVTYWLETHYHVSTTNEDNLVSCHNSEVHRNSTSSEITCSDDLNSCSSNEDMEMQKKSNKSTARHANNNRQNKRQTKRKQNAANKQQQQQQQQQNQHNNNNNNQNGNVQQQKLRVQQQNTMDVDDVEESKENQIPTVITTNNNHRNYHNNNNNNNNHNNNSNNNTAHKGRHAINNKRGKNTRISVLTKEPALVKNNSNSTVNIHSSNSSTTSNSANSSPTASPAAQKRSVDNIKKIVRALVPNYMTETVMPFLQITESQFYMALQRHLVPKNLLRVYGYPVESVFHEGCVEIFKLTPRSNFNSMRGIVNICDDMLTTQASPKSTNVVNPNDSGKGSSDISPPDLDCEIVEDEVTQPTASYQPDDNYQIFSQYDQSLKKKCVRCKASFHVTEGGQYVTREECVFHWGKKYQLYDAGQKLMDAYSCCNKELTAVGCSRNKLHVWNGAVMGINGPYTDFVYTYEHYNLDGTVRHSNKVFALDCEMSYTAHGLDLTKVTLINADGNIVYEKFVIPAAEIADYNTRFSGITQEDLCPKSNIALKTLPEVQRDLLEIISADSILIGHGLDNDLRALRMVHKTIVDTSVTYPHRNGFPYRLSLKHLARSYLGRNIQASGLGHSSLEDSLAALHLMYVKVQSDQYSSKAYE